LPNDTFFLLRASSCSERYLLISPFESTFLTYKSLSSSLTLGSSMSKSYSCRILLLSSASGLLITSSSEFLRFLIMTLSCCSFSSHSVIILSTNFILLLSGFCDILIDCYRRLASLISCFNLYFLSFSNRIMLLLSIFSSLASERSLKSTSP